MAASLEKRLAKEGFVEKFGPKDIVVTRATRSTNVYKKMWITYTRPRNYSNYLPSWEDI